MTARPWPPTAAERAAIDAAHAQAVAVAAEEEQSSLEFRDAAENWLCEVAPELFGAEPVHEATITVPGRDDISLALVEFDPGGRFCAGALGPGRYAFGTAVDVVGRSTGGIVAEGWVGAVGERWTGNAPGQRDAAPCWR